ncbi:type I-C CRISPR-associated protein Cas8c/Csd1 [Rubellimicrobium rubrum]|uniref:Type I-C CRISPR-associated protein Cas8c/Csd1 n=1 Tax=Rubellimicrobium rubrum TaxID=2585369 RepID=A0A5C4N073_9RHOB|nr:type I-C CRISPR-associated protein Cas8c/Csd1 [Rubellimicrobium rubrum]TNC49611.1 type I-C CRISPR-associated protein Cas8c/Csd1 [Rubellimicrobium rubrum]
MSVLASLVRAYDRLPDAPPFGFSPEKVGAVVTLRPDGSVVAVTDWRTEGKKRQPRPMLVPRPVKRTVAIAPNFLWDKTAYALGLTAGAGKRTAEEHAAFKARHAEWLTGTEDEGLRAFLIFLDGWTPDPSALLGWSDELLDLNVAFALGQEFLHDRPAAREAWRIAQGEGVKDAQACLASGEVGPVARLHPAIRGVWGAQSSGASLVSFNLDSFTSYGHEQGDNAPISEASAFAYAAALNHYLRTGSQNRVQIGDASVAFWADAEDRAAGQEAESIFAGFLAEPIKAGAAEDAAQAKLVADKLTRIRRGEPLAEVEPKLAEGVRFHVLGLAPNAARLSVRFAWESSFGALTAHYQRFQADMAIEPPARTPHPPLWQFLRELAVQGKSENVPPKLAGEWLRAILAGTRYPATLLTAVLMRTRADQEMNALRAAIIRAVLVRNFEKEVPVSLDEDNPSPAYQLGRLFAVLEGAQYAALGRVNAPIGDRYYAAASSTPARVFAPLLRGLKVHVADARKRGRGGWIEPRVAEIMDRLPPDLPRALRLEDQGRFAIGYYHEKARRPAKAEEETVIEDVQEGTP